MKSRDKAFSFLDVVVITTITSVVMCLLGGILIYKHLGGVNYSLLGTDDSLKEFITVYNNLLDKYYDSLDNRALIDGAIDGMYKMVGDPYTTYLDSSSTENLNDSLTGEYNGIGIKFEDRGVGQFYVTKVYDNSSASRVGIEVGDKIISINNIDVSSKTSNEVKTMIKSSGSNVSITIKRGETNYNYNVEVQNLLVPAVSSEIIQKDGHNIGYIKLTIFNDSADVQFTNALTDLENKHIESLIIDLRGNTGGYLQVAKNIAEMFINKGNIIYSLENKDGKKDYKDETNESRSYKIALVTDKESASASEILAAALKYSYGATIVGEKTYGKGKVQEKSSLTDGTTIKYTTAKWLTPNGDCIDGTGLIPDTLISLDKWALNEDDITTDNQVMKAVEQLVD